MNIKYKKFLLSVTTSLIITANLQAVLVSWQSGINFSTPANDIVTTGNLLEARNYGTFTDQVVNGINFLGIGNGNGELANTFNSALGSALPDADYSNLLTTAAFTVAGIPANISFAGLTVGQDYLVQFWYADTRDGIPSRSSTITSDQGGPDEASGNFSKTQFIVGTFTADSNNISFSLEIDGGLGAHLNAAQLRAVPETETYALIFGGLSLGMVLMIRRRRSKNLN